MDVFERCARAEITVEQAIRILSPEPRMPWLVDACMVVAIVIAALLSWTALT